MSGVRGVFVFAPGLSALVTEKRKLTRQNHREACRQQAQALIEALILYAHEQLQLGQHAVDLFAALFTKQQPVMAR